MDINTNNQQINVFHKGMNTDASDSLIGHDEYRLAKNLRYITNCGENTGELRLIEGVTEFDGCIPEGITLTKVIKTASIRDYGIIIGTIKIASEDDNQEPSLSRLALSTQSINPSDREISPNVADNPWLESGYLYDSNNVQDSYFQTYVEKQNFYYRLISFIGVPYLDGTEEALYLWGTNGYPPVTINASVQHMSEKSGVTKTYDQILHLYVDEINSLLSSRGDEPLNVVYVEEQPSGDPDDPDEPDDPSVDPSDDPSEDPDEPKIKWGVIRFNNDSQNKNPQLVFGPCKDTLGDNVSVVLRYEALDNVKLYIADGLNPLMLMSLTPSGDNIPTTIGQISSKSTNVSLPSPTINGVIRGNIEAAIVQYAYCLYNPHLNLTEISPVSKPQKLKKGGKGVDMNNIVSDNGVSVSFTIPENSSFSHIRVYRLSYKLNGDRPYVHIIREQKINSASTVNVQDITNDGLYTSTIEEFQSAGGVFIIPNVIESKDDRLFAANVKYVSYANESIKNWDARAYTSGTLVNGERVYTSTDPTDQQIAFEDIPEDADITNINIDLSVGYDSSAWMLNGLYRGDGLNVSYKLVNPSGDRRLRPDELYRYGIVLYDTDGQRYPAKWIADIRIPDGGNGKCLEVTVKNLPENIVRYEIVRAERTSNDRATITQGLIGRLLESRYEYEDPQTHVSSKSNLLCPSHILTTNNISVFGYDNTNVLTWQKKTEHCSVSTRKAYMFISPEITYFQNAIKDDIGNKNVYFREVSYLYPELGDKITAYPQTYAEPSSVELIGPTDIEIRSSAIKFPNPLRFTKSFFPSNIEGINGYGAADDKSLGYFSFTAMGHTYGIMGESDHSGAESDYRDEPVRTANNLITVDLTGADGRVRTLQTGLKRLNVDKYAFISAPKFNLFSDGQTINVISDAVILGNNIISPWTMQSWLYQNSTDMLTNLANSFKTRSDNANGFSTPMCPISNALVFSFLNEDLSNTLLRKSENVIDYGYGQSYFKLLCESDDLKWVSTKANAFGAVLANLRQDVVPYNGSNYQSVQSTMYTSYGIVSDLIGSGVYVDDGDTYYKQYHHLYARKFIDPKYMYAGKATVIYKFNVLTDIDTDYDFGAKVQDYIPQTVEQASNTQTHCGMIQNDPVVITTDNFDWTLDEALYKYNTVYSTTMASTINPAQTSDSDVDIENYDYRVCYSNPKVNNESSDSWLTFQSINFLDVDTRYGEITGLRLFKNKLMYWQESATGVLSVNERQLVLTVDDTTLTLGTGDVLQRFDYLSTEYGMHKNDNCDSQTNTSLYWWDSNKREIIGFVDLIIPMGKIYNIRNYINAHNNITNPKVAHDDKYDEVLFNVVDGGTISYNESLKAFTSVYDIDYTNSIHFKNRLLMLSNNDVYEWNTNSGNVSNGFDNQLLPYVKYVVNQDSAYTKVYDNCLLGGNFYDDTEKDSLFFTFKTPLKQEGRIDGTKITNTEYDFRFAVPRAGKNINGDWKTSDYGDRLRGKTMLCELASTSNSLDFSLLYITTKFRLSWI